MPTITLTDIVLQRDGEPWASAEVRFSPREFFIADDGAYPQKGLTATTDTNGAYSVDLAVPDDGSSSYLVAYPEKSGTHQIVVSSVDDGKTVRELIGSNTTADPSLWQAALALHVAAADPHEQYVTNSELGATLEDYASATDLATTSTALTSHTGNTSNPHATTAAQVGAYTTGQIDTAIAAFSALPFVTVAATGAANAAAYDYQCDGTADDVQILQAAAAMPAAGGTVHLGPGTFTIAALIDLSADTGIRIIGSGQNATIITAASSYTGSLISLGEYCALESLSILIPTTTTANAVVIDHIDDRLHLRDLYLATAGTTNSASAYAISIRNSFCVHVENVRMRVSCNGWEIAMTDGAFNYGNGAFISCEVGLTAAGRIGWDIHAIAGSPPTKNYNLLHFLYCSAVTGSGTGSTGIRIRNCSWLTFIGADLEIVATSVEIQGTVNSGQSAQNITFINPYFGAGTNAVIGSAAFATTFVGGRILGTVTDAGQVTGKTTRYFGTTDANGLHIADTTTVLKTGPRFGVAGMTCKLRNQTGTTLARGSVVKQATGNDFAVQLTTAGTSPQWVGLVLADTAAAGDADIGVSGIFYALSTNAATRGDYIVLDTATNGSCKSNGTTLPANIEHVVGRAMETTSGAGLVATLIKTAA